MRVSSLSTIEESEDDRPHRILDRSRKLAELHVLRRRIKMLETELAESTSHKKHSAQSAPNSLGFVSPDETPEFWPKDFGPMPTFFLICESREEVDDWNHFFELWNP